MKKIINIEIENYGIIQFLLRDDLSPINCEKFVSFVKQGLFNSRIIQRIAPDFVLQFTYENYLDPLLECILPLERCDLPFKKGVVALGGDGQKISSPADFFITISDTDVERLNHNFTVIGEVISGYELVEKIIKVPSHQIIMEDAPGVSIYRPNQDIIVKQIFISEE